MVAGEKGKVPPEAETKYDRVVKDMREIDRILGGADKYTLERDEKDILDVNVLDEDTILGEVLTEDENSKIFMFENDINDLSSEEQKKLVDLHNQDFKNTPEKKLLDETE